MKKILFIFGTRPEAIKMAPLIKKFQNKKDIFEVKVCITAQHRDMLDQVLDFFNIKVDYDLNLMKQNQSLFDITSDCLINLKPVLQDFEPDLVFVQGDTSTAFSAALSCFYLKIKVAHIEAGLRSGAKWAPYPEEINRKLISSLADYHFPPTPLAKDHLLKENFNKNIWITGNTVIDALFLGLKIIKDQGEASFQQYFNFLDFSKKILLITGHRRENFGKPFENICQAIKDIACRFPELQIVYPVHLNPNVQKPVNLQLKNINNIFLIKPLDYAYLIYLMNKSTLILTDSGGIQEEGPSLGKPVLVMREVTERPEGVDAGTAKLVGVDKDLIVNEVSKLLSDENHYNSMSKAVNPYGDGTASQQICNIIKNELC